MKPIRPLWIHIALVVALTPVFALTAQGAGTIVNSLTGFTGDSSVAGTQASLLSAGFEFASIAGLAEDFSSDPRVVFDSSGASFGSLYAGDGGRNYMRTVDSYAFDSYVAEVTVVVDALSTEVVFFGMGSGNITLWGVPDFAGVPSVFMTPEGGKLMTNGVDGISGDWENPAPCTTGDWCPADAPGLVSGVAGTHRLRMTLDAEAKQWTAAIDIDYTGGPFVADVTSLTYNLTNMYDDGGFVTLGWPTNPSKIYFGGDDTAIFKDFSVIVGSAPVEDADFDDDDDVDGRDFLIWQRGFGVGTTNATGDADGNGSVDGADLVIWQGQYGAGGVATISVPEPSGIFLCFFGTAGLALKRRRS